MNIPANSTEKTAGVEHNDTKGRKALVTWKVLNYNKTLKKSILTDK
jgi:hypothetical protein